MGKRGEEADPLLFPGRQRRRRDARLGAYNVMGVRYVPFYD